MLKITLALVLFIQSMTTLATTLPDLPRVAREFRGVWVASVENIDWPSSTKLSVEEQKAEFISLIARVKKLNMNAVLLQVRPAADALYASSLEPWSPYLTGTMGQPTSPFYDPLEFAIEVAHKSGIQVHAWFNPYRAGFDTTRFSSDHIYKRRPDLVRKYGKLLWLDPGEKETQNHSLKVILDVATRYNVDGIHFDDYFYPYPLKDDNGRTVPFPDDASWKKYRAAGGKLGRDDWRRDNVNQLVKKTAAELKKIKPSLLFGISPFGIWRPGYPSGVTGLDAYAEIFADARKWLQEGWIDYISPQLYWKIDSKGQSFPKLLNWWASQNTLNRHMWPGHYTSLVEQWGTSEVLNQIKLTQAHSKVSGSAHFSYETFKKNTKKINEALLSGPYKSPSLIPTAHWKSTISSTDAPTFDVTLTEETYSLSWQDTSEAISNWVIYYLDDGIWNYKILPRTDNTLELSKNAHPRISAFALSSVDSFYQESQPTISVLEN